MGKLILLQLVTAVQVVAVKVRLTKQMEQVAQVHLDKDSTVELVEQG
jgi:hypothetical protein